MHWTAKRQNGTKSVRTETVGFLHTQEGYQPFSVSLCFPIPLHPVSCNVYVNQSLWGLLLMYLFTFIVILWVARLILCRVNRCMQSFCDSLHQGQGQDYKLCLNFMDPSLVFKFQDCFPLMALPPPPAPLTPTKEHRTKQQLSYFFITWFSVFDSRQCFHSIFYSFNHSQMVCRDGSCPSSIQMPPENFSVSYSSRVTMACMAFDFFFFGGGVILWNYLFIFLKIFIPLFLSSKQCTTIKIQD